MTARLSRTRPCSRRTLLGSALAAGTTALAGCMSTLPPLGQRVRYGRVDSPARQEPSYGDWLPAPGALEHGSGDPIDPLSTAVYTTPGNLGREIIGADLSLGSSIMRSSLDYLGVGFDAYDWALGVGPGIVLAGDVPVDDVGRTLTSTVYDPAGDHLDFELYRRRDRDRAVGVSGTHVVFGIGDRAMETVRTVVEVGRGRRDGVVDADDAAALFVDAVGASPFTWYGPDFFGFDRPGERDGPLDTAPIASAHSYQFTEAAMYFIVDALFEAGEVPSRRVVRDELESRSMALQSMGVDVSLTDRMVTVEMRIEAADVNRDASQLVVPQVTWSATYDGDSNVLTVTHHAGDPVDATSLSVQLEDGPATDRLDPTTGTVQPGDTLTVDLSGVETESVRIYTSTADRNRQSILFSTGIHEDGPERSTDETENGPEDEPDDRS